MSDILLVLIALAVVGAVLFFKKKSADSAAETQPEPAKEETTPSSPSEGKPKLDESQS